MIEQSFIQGYVDRFRDKHTITVATGVTCSYLGDERNLREYLVADEVVKALRAHGHVVHYFCFDDDLDPLSFRQLRVAVLKDPDLVTKYEPFCGKPACDIRSPFDPNSTWSEYFEGKFKDRLSALDCHPNVVSVSRMYERGLYAPYIKQVLVHQDRIREYLSQNFPAYQPEKLFWAICPTCGYIDGTQILDVNTSSVEIACQRCLCQTSVAFEDLRGKLNWKLDCAARWAMFKVDAEPFSKAYLEPNAGSFFVARGLSKTFFGGSDVTPIQYGSVSMSTSLSYKLLESLPSNVFRNLMVRHPRTDLDITEERILTEANKVEVLPGLSFANLVKQLLPAWILDSKDLTAEQRELMMKGMAFARSFERKDIKPYLPNRSHLEGVPVDILRQIQSVIQQVILHRKAFGMNYDSFVGPAKAAIERLGDQRREVTTHFRKIIGQEAGVPNSRYLFLLPISYLMNLESLIDLYLESKAPSHAVIQIPDRATPPPLRVIPGERLATNA